MGKMHFFNSGSKAACGQDIRFVSGSSEIHQVSCEECLLKCVEQLQAQLTAAEKALEQYIELGCFVANDGSTDEKGYICKVVRDLATQQERVKELENENANLSEDLAYHKAILDGSWPSSKQILENALKNKQGD